MTEKERILEYIKKLTDLFGSADAISNMLVQQYEEQEDAVTTLAEENRENVQTLKTLEESQEQLLEEKTNFETRVKELAEENKTLAENLTEREKKLDETVKTLGEKENEYREKTKEVESLESLKRRLESERDDFKQKVEETGIAHTDEKKKEYEEERRKLNDLIDELEIQKQNLLAKISELETKRSDPSASEKFKAKYEEQIQALKEDIRAAREQQEAYRIRALELEELIAGRSGKDVLKKELERIRGEEKEKAKAIDSLEDDRKKIVEEVERLRNEIAARDEALARYQKGAAQSPRAKTSGASKASVSENDRDALVSDLTEKTGLSGRTVSKLLNALPDEMKRSAPELPPENERAQHALAKLAAGLDAMDARATGATEKMLERLLTLLENGGAGQTGAIPGMKDKVFTLIEKIENSRVEIHPMGGGAPVPSAPQPIQIVAAPQASAPVQMPSAPQPSSPATRIEPAPSMPFESPPAASSPTASQPPSSPSLPSPLPSSDRGSERLPGMERDRSKIDPGTVSRIKLDTRDDDYDSNLVITYSFDDMPESLSYSKFKPLLKNATRITLLGNLQEGLDMFRMIKEQNLPKEYKDMIEKNIQDISYYLRGFYRAELE